MMKDYGKIMGNKRVMRFALNSMKSSLTIFKDKITQIERVIDHNSAQCSYQVIELFLDCKMVFTEIDQKLNDHLNRENWAHFPVKELRVKLLHLQLVLRTLEGQLHLV